MLKLVPDIAKSRLSRGNTGADQRAQEAFSLIRQRILERDSYTCQGCGLGLAPIEIGGPCGLEVHHINANPRDNRPDNLISLCPLCHGIFHIGCFARRIGQGMRAIHCPELSQASLNLLSWTMALVFMKTKESCEASERVLQKKAERLRLLLLQRENFPKSYFHNDEALATFHEQIKGQDNIAYLGSLLGMLRTNYPKLYFTRRQKLLGGLRIFYDPQEPLIFCHRQGHNMLSLLDQSPQWESGSDWSKTWAIIGQTLKSKKP